MTFMKKALLTLFIAAVSLFPSFSAVTFPESVSTEDRAVLSSFFSNAISGRRERDITVNSFSSDGHFTISFSIDGKEMRLSAPSMDVLGEFIDNALSLEESLYLENSTLYYVTDDIIASHDSYRKGCMVEAYDASGDKRALLETVDNMNGSSIYSPVYQKDRVAGLRLEPGPSFALYMNGSSTLRFNSFSFSLALAYLPFLPYFNPLASFLVSYDGNFSFYGGLGLEARLPLERLLDTHFTLIEEGAVFANAILYLGYDGAFDAAATYSVGYEHHISARTLWRIGYETGTIVENTVMLSFGVMF